MKTIGVEVAPEHAFGRAFLEGVASFAAKRDDWRLSSLSQDSIRTADLSKYDGLILRLFDDDLAKRANAAGVPLVDIYCDHPRTDVAQIRVGGESIGRMAAEFFLGRGFRSFAWCGLEGVADSDLIGEHFQKTLSDAGFGCPSYRCRHSADQLINCTKPDVIPDARSLRKWLEGLSRPTAVFCCNDHRAYHVLRIALEMKADIPQDFAILGCDNDTLICSFSQVPLSSIDSGAFRLGHSAARILSALIARPARRKHHRPFVIEPAAIIERQSTEHIPIDPPWLSEALLAIEKNLGDGITAADVVRRAGLSATTVEQVFRKKLKASVIGYITAMRMKKARHLLLTTDLLTKEIAAACGYSSPQYFCRAFKAECGENPQTYAARRGRGASGTNPAPPSVTRLFPHGN